MALRIKRVSLAESGKKYVHRAKSIFNSKSLGEVGNLLKSITTTGDEGELRKFGSFLVHVYGDNMKSA
jgi:hypothetical protein